MMFWNCRGLNSADSPTIPYLIWLVHKFSPEVLFLMETKSDDNVISKVAKVLGFGNFLSCNAVGLAGGLAFILESMYETCSL